MAYGLDTSIAVAILRTRKDQAARLRLQGVLDDGQPIWVSSLVVHELITGAMKDQDPPRSLEKLDRFLSRLAIAELTADDAISAARVRVELERRGALIGSIDMLIAGQALARGWVLATSDAHFLRVDGLTAVDWTRTDQPVNRLDKMAELIRRQETEE